MDIYITVGVVTRLQAGRSGFRIPARGRRFFFCPKRPDRLWCPPRLLFNGYRSSFQGVKRRERNVDTHLHLVPRLRTSGDIHLPLSPLICLHGVLLTVRATFFKVDENGVPSLCPLPCHRHTSSQWYRESYWRMYEAKLGLLLVGLWVLLLVKLVKRVKYEGLAYKSCMAGVGVMF
jgi:hypothetical protein